MAIENINHEMLLGLGGVISLGLNGWMAFNRYWVSNRAKNANDIQQIDMLERQESYIARLEIANQQLREEITLRDGTIREYWKTITATQARLQIIESAQTYLKAQNDSLKQQVGELTASNLQLISEMNLLRASLEASD